MMGHPVDQLIRLTKIHSRTLLHSSTTVRIASDHEIRKELRGRDEHAANAERALPEADQDQVHLERGRRQEKVPQGLM